jgi:hypothetical protein
MDDDPALRGGPMQVVQFADAGKMTVAEYRQRRAELRATYGDSKQDARGLADQALAMFFDGSKWTQEELAHEEHRQQPWISRHLLFGAFLKNMPRDIIPKKLTEKRFREYWKRTEHEPNQRVRYRLIVGLIEEDVTLSKSTKKKPAIADAIKTTSATGAWHRFSTIVTNVRTLVPEATEEDIEAVLKTMIYTGSYNVFCEKKKGVDHYRIVLGGKQKIDLVALQKELGPLIERLKAEGRKNMATMSPPTVAHLAFELERLLVKLARIAPED